MIESEGEDWDDEFNNKGKFHANLSENNKVLVWKKFFSDGGLAYLKWSIDPVLEKNVFKFWIKDSRKMDILIGLEKPLPQGKKVWYLKIISGEFVVD